MASMGAPQADIDRCEKQWKAELPEFEYTEVMPENILAFEAFRSLQDQWQYPSSMGGRLCLPHTDVLACIQGLGLASPHDTFRRVLRIAAAARPVLMKKYEGNTA